MCPGRSGGSSRSFFFSSRRRHTRCSRDWSSDVCSSDLTASRPPFSPEQVTGEYAKLCKAYHVTQVVGDHYAGEFPRELFRNVGIEYRPAEIGRASCRERV